MISACPKCHQLYEGLESEAHKPDRRCPRCASIAELLESAEALNSRIRSELARPGRMQLAVIRRTDVAPLLERSEIAVLKARAL